MLEEDHHTTEPYWELPTRATVQRALHKIPLCSPKENPLREALFYPHLIEEETEAKQSDDKQRF